jgi:membrane dipeptidase
MRRAGIGICVATQISRYVKPGRPVPASDSPEKAWARTQRQLAWYRDMEERGEMIQITDSAGLVRHGRKWRAAHSGPHPAAESAETVTPIGYILALEGADSLVTLRHLERSYAEGLRALGPAHYGPGIYAPGTDAEGPLTARGRELLAEMDRLGLILDVTHLTDEGMREALDLYQGPVWASHSNCRALAPHHRQLADDQIKALVERGAVIGGALDAWMMVPGWIRGKTTPESSGVQLEHLVDHIDHVCQLAGNARHSGIGTDLDGGFGREQCPRDLDTIADLHALPAMFARRGYRPEDTEAILHGNFMRFLKNAWKR